jgi:3-mercaptopyruvate sulfurtransferase SseA
LDGGLPRWIAEGHEIARTESDEGLLRSIAFYEGTPSDLPLSNYPLPQQAENSFKSYEDVVKNSDRAMKGDIESSLVIDARPAARSVDDG